MLQRLPRRLSDTRKKFFFQSSSLATQELELEARAEVVEVLRKSPGIMKLIETRIFKFQDFLTNGALDQMNGRMTAADAVCCTSNEEFGGRILKQPFLHFSHSLSEPISHASFRCSSGREEPSDTS